MEAVLTRTDVKFDKLRTNNFWEIGAHARDVLGKYASRCQTRRLILDLIWQESDPQLAFDPWRISDGKEKEEDYTGDGINWINGDHVLDVALGAAIALVNSEIGDQFEDRFEEDTVMKIAQQGARKGLDMGLVALGSSLDAFEKQIKD